MSGEPAGLCAVVPTAAVLGCLCRKNTHELITPLVMATSWGYVATCEALVKIGADPNLPAGHTHKPPVHVRDLKSDKCSAHYAARSPRLHELRMALTCEHAASGVGGVGHVRACGCGAGHCAVQ